VAGGPAEASQADEPIIWIEDEPPDLSDVRPEDGLVLMVFWALAVVVFLQFFTRYVLNSSLGWTEEIARYLLIAVTFLGSAMAVRKHSHIAVEFFYRYFGPTGRHRLALAVDAICLLFYLAAAWSTGNLALKTRQLMSSVDLSKSLIYWAVCLGLVGMSLYAARNLAHRLRSPPSDEDLPHSRLID
jgi:TRAP-type transport system small permease protein